MSELPRGWAQAALGDLAEFTNGKAFKKEEWREIGKPIIRIQNLNNPSAAFNYGDDSHEKKYLVRQGDLLVSWSASLGVYYWHGKEAWLNQHIFRVHSLRGCDKRFLKYALEISIDDFYAKAHGMGMVHITKGSFENHLVSLPPLAEQSRIAQKLDEHLAQVNTLKASINAIPTLLKRFRQSVLAAAVSGRLTKEWRAENSSCAAHTQLSNLQANNDTLPDTSSLPMGWYLAIAADICGFITKGTTPSKEKMTAGQGDVPYIKVYNLTFSGSLDFSVDPTFVDFGTHSVDLKRSIVKPGDVLMNIVGPPLGKVSIVPATYPEWNINQAIARFRAGDGISSGYLALCLRTEETLNHAASRAKATSGQLNLTLEICRQLPLRVPPKVEQTEIVHRVEQLFAFADQLEAKVVSAKSRIDHLTQSILAKAFRGELVPQDPNDEPASVLLERTRAQRAAQPKVRRGCKGALTH
ncbi:restriction endonuclease subunit S [Pseudomonas viridiflava]|uniref:restriction endonuclease subunit S n=1 Tax=Pseudomonas viridiflava TaxID=33069 RepID=UPI001C2CFAFB|nr:restriction endonuclease subunit S [Pseudomonas viridiflava]MBV1816084.1 restriction endonuclease subunit S [Pseudomonas viridiflava]